MLAPILPLADPNANNVAIARQAPSTAALLGGDPNGRDVLARVVYGARASLLIGVGAIVIGLAVGGLLGLVGGYYRGRLDTIVGERVRRDARGACPHPGLGLHACSSEPKSAT